MQIQHTDDGRQGRFFIAEEDKELAEMSYVWHGSDHIIILHTEVDHSMEGKGVGKALVAESVRFAQEKGIRILPWCPFAKQVMEHKPEFAAVLYKS